MKIFHTVKDLQQAMASVNGNVGFVPTMGALHKGHLSLIDKARSENDVVVASIFVNPIQFNNPDDLAKYPRTLEADCALLERTGCDIVFAPSEEEMYPEGKDVAFENDIAGKLDFGMLDKVMEGAFRPGHFNGVAVVVRRLFDIVKPTVAYFGKKDLQQVSIIRCMVLLLKLPVRIEICPVVREFDGLAISSRNTLLTHEGRIVAPQIHRILSEVIATGGSVEFVKSRVVSELEDYFKVDYFEIVDCETLKSVPAFWIVGGCDEAGSGCSGGQATNGAGSGCSGCGSGQATACVAVWLGNIRLIDNLNVSLKLGANTELSCSERKSA
ncbi:MAG: pantoate--beta-alanine ligase [Bacteroidales bacterium]|jgi:pantoate--beta-alanine ligase|nr:pantoate--beta-alanine ligase [Bacteroidales bacterium]